MFRFVARLLVLLAAVQILGGHWAVLQGVAWVSMVIENVQTESWPEALEKTFDGAHPCRLCVAVKKGVDEEKKQETTMTLVKLEAVLAAGVCVPPPLVAEGLHPMLVAPLAARSSAPPTPPPLA